MRPRETLPAPEKTSAREKERERTREGQSDSLVLIWAKVVPVDVRARGSKCLGCHPYSGPNGPGQPLEEQGRKTAKRIQGWTTSLSQKKPKKEIKRKMKGLMAAGKSRNFCLVKFSARK